MNWMYFRLGSGAFALAVVWMASQALDSGGPVAVYAVAALVYALAKLVSSLVDR